MAQSTFTPYPRSLLCSKSIVLHHLNVSLCKFRQQVPKYHSNWIFKVYVRVVVEILYKYVDQQHNEMVCYQDVQHVSTSEAVWRFYRLDSIERTTQKYRTETWKPLFLLWELPTGTTKT